MMISCRKATELASRALDAPLSRRERLALRLHLWVCQRCRRYRRQLLLLRQAVRQGRLEDWLPPARLSPEARRRILKRLGYGD